MDRVCATLVCSLGDKMVWMKRLYYLIGLVVGMVILVLGQMPGEKARMVMCDVGQGDAILIIKGNKQVLIDGGPSSEKILSCLEQYIPFYDRTIELIVLTNTDFDHMQGLSSVVERYSVIEFVTSDGVHGGDALNKLTYQLVNAQIKVKGLERGDTIRVGEVSKGDGLELRVLWPPDAIAEYSAVFSDEIDDTKREQILGASAKRGNLNERSVVLLVLEDNKQILLMGDAGDQAEKELLLSGNLPDIDILKVGHHGSKYASSLEFLEKVRPELAVISVGVKNRYGHPTRETLGRLQQIGAQVQRTDTEGTIVIEL